MKLYLKQKVFSWRDRFYAKDENGADKFYNRRQNIFMGQKTARL